MSGKGRGGGAEEKFSQEHGAIEFDALVALSRGMFDPALTRWKYAFILAFFDDAALRDPFARPTWQSGPGRPKTP